MRSRRPMTAENIPIMGFIRDVIYFGWYEWCQESTQLTIEQAGILLPKLVECMMMYKSGKSA